MRGRENIKKNAKAALKQILMDPDYQFVTDHESFFRADPDSVHACAAG